MRAKLILAVIFAISVFLVSYTTVKTKKVTEEISTICDKTEERIRKKEENCFFELESAWKKHRSYLSMVYHHSELDSIEESINRIKKYYELNDENATLSELSTVRFKTVHLPDGDKLLWGNVF